MKLFPKNSISFYSEKGNEIKSEMEDFYQDYNDKNQAFWYQAALDSRFYSGDQTVWPEVYPNAPVHRRNVFSFNRIRRVVEMISGCQRRNRMSTTIDPVENGDQKTADQYSKIISHIHRKEYVPETISASFNDSVKTGLSLLYLWNDYRDDPVSGSLKVDNLSYNSFIIDPYFRKQDLSDCKCLWKRTYISKQQVKMLLPDKKEMIEEVAKESMENIFTFMPEHSKSNKSDLLAYDEYYYLDSRKQDLLIDSQTGQTTEWTGSSDFGLEAFLRANPTIKLSVEDKQTVKLAIFVQGTLVYDGRNPLGIDRFPFAPVFGYFDPNLEDYSLKLQSVVRGLRDPQYLFNYRKNVEMDFFDSQLNSGFIYKENAPVNPDDIHLRGQGKGVALKATAEMTDIQPIQPPQIPPSMFQLSELMAKEISEISGVNEELLGSATDDKAGVLARQRMGAGLTTLQTLFDQLDMSQRLLGSITLEAIQANYTPGKVKRIIEEEPEPQFYSKAFGTYDACVTAGFNTATQRAQELHDLLKLKEFNIAVPDSTIIEAATVQNKTKLLEQMAKEAQAKQQQEQQAEQVQQQLQVAQSELAKAKVQSDISLAKERDSRVYSNIGLMEERRQEAEKDKTQSMLNLVKTLQEIDSVDIEQLNKLIMLSRVVEGEATKDDNAEKLGSAIVTGVTKETSPISSPTKGV